MMTREELEEQDFIDRERERKFSREQDITDALRAIGLGDLPDTGGWIVNPIESIGHVARRAQAKSVTIPGSFKGRGATLTETLANWYRDSIGTADNPAPSGLSRQNLLDIGATIDLITNGKAGWVPAPGVKMTTREGIDFDPGHIMLPISIQSVTVTMRRKVLLDKFTPLALRRTEDGAKALMQTWAQRAIVRAGHTIIQGSGVLEGSQSDRIDDPRGDTRLVQSYRVIEYGQWHGLPESTSAFSAQRTDPVCCYYPEENHRQ